MELPAISSLCQGLSVGFGVSPPRGPAEKQSGRRGLGAAALTSVRRVGKLPSGLWETRRKPG